jgi:hypothetical protein
MLFKLKPGVGNHSEKDPKTGKVTIYHSKDGEIIDSDKNLCQIFPDKFEQVNVGGVVVQDVNTPKKAKTPVQKAAEKGAKDIAPPKETEKKKTAKSLGRDITEKNFPEVGEQDFKVFYTPRKGYFVTENEDISVAINDTPLKKDEVTAFVENYLKG